MAAAGGQGPRLERPGDVATEPLDLFTAFQGSRGCDVEQRQQPPAQAAAIQVSLLSVLLRQDVLIIFDDEAVWHYRTHWRFSVCPLRAVSTFLMLEYPFVSSAVT